MANIIVCEGCEYADQYIPDSPICKECLEDAENMRRPIRATESIAKELQQLNKNVKKMAEALGKMEKALNKNSGRR